MLDPREQNVADLYALRTLVSVFIAGQLRHDPNGAAVFAAIAESCRLSVERLSLDRDEPGYAEEFRELVNHRLDHLLASIDATLRIPRGS
jgi:hypothetical protein